LTVTLYIPLLRSFLAHHSLDQLDAASFRENILVLDQVLTTDLNERRILGTGRRPTTDRFWVVTAKVNQIVVR
jgi:hypothetical protein